MNSNRCNCYLISAIIGILAGVVLGVLYSLGFVLTGIIFWAFLAFGVLSLLVSPLYEGDASYGCDECFCRLRQGFLVYQIGTLLLSAVGLIIAPFAPVLAVAIILGIATFFAVSLLSLHVCLVNCVCRK